MNSPSELLLVLGGLLLAGLIVLVAYMAFVVVALAACAVFGCG